MFIKYFISLFFRVDQTALSKCTLTVRGSTLPTPSSIPHTITPTQELPCTRWQPHTSTPHHPRINATPIHTYTVKQVSIIISSCKLINDLHKKILLLGLQELKNLCNPYMGNPFYLSRSFS